MSFCFSLTRRLLLCLSLTLTAGLSHSAAQAAPGDLDPSFGTGGKVTHDFGVLGGTGGEAYAVQVLSDGKILLAGSSAYGAEADFAVLRLQPDGTLDPAFGHNGKVAVPLGDREDIPHAMALDAQNRIVVAGEYNVGQQTMFGVIRLMPDGALDTTFGDGGKVLFPAGDPSFSARGVAIDGEGRIVLGGKAYANGKTGFAAARLLENGQFDNSFDGDGRRQVFFDSSWGFAVNVMLGAHGKIIMAGEADNAFAAARLNENGALDKNFGGTGKVTYPAGRSLTQAFAATLDGKNRILVTGDADGHMAMTRIKPDGSLDASFNDDGIRTVSINNSFGRAYGITTDSQLRIVLTGSLGNHIAVVRLTESGDLATSLGGTGKIALTTTPVQYQAYAVEMDAQGHIMLAGSTNAYGSGDMCVVRLTGSGEFDPTFSQGGIKSHFYAGNDRACGIRRLSNGRIIVAGTASNLNDDDFAVAAFNADGSLDTTFGENGQVLLPMGAGDDRADCMVTDSQNRILVAGAADNELHSAQIALVRLNPDGSLDTSFNGTGRLIFDLPGHLYAVTALRLDHNGKILLACRGNEQSAFVLIRLNPNGTLDKTFGNAGVLLDQGQRSGEIWSMVIDAKNRILLTVGPYRTSLGLNGNRLLRLTSSGQVDTSFGNQGRRLLTNDTAHSQTFLGALALAPDGKIVVGASIENGPMPGRLWRFNPNGTTDETFGNNGQFDFNFGDYQTYVTAVAVRADGRIVVAGTTAPIWTVYGAPGDFAVAIVNANGGLDSTFGNGGIVTTDFYKNSDYLSGLSLYDDGRILVAGGAAGGVDGSADFALARYFGPAIEAPQSTPSGSARVF